MFQKGDGTMSIVKEDLHQLYDETKWQMYEYLFGQSNVELEDILMLCHYRLRSECFYCVDVMVIRDLKSRDQWTAILAYTREYFRRIAPEAILVSGPQPGIAAHVLPARSKVARIKPFKLSLEKRFQVTAFFGRSQPHPLNNLRKGCDEARIALYYPMIMETRPKIQCFLDMGYFTFLFSQELETVKQYCYNTLMPLYDHDLNNKSSLLPTLAVLVKSNFNLKETARNLFIHINTLYYRINKIELLLCVDISLANARLNLFTALKAWALLHISGLWDWSFGLQIGSFFGEETVNIWQASQDKKIEGLY